MQLARRALAWHNLALGSVGNKRIAHLFLAFLHSQAKIVVRRSIWAGVATLLVHFGRNDVCAHCWVCRGSFVLSKRLVLDEQVRI